MRYILDIDQRLGIEDPFLKAFSPEIIYILGEINEESAAIARREIEISENNALVSGQKIIPICIDSYGGDIYALLSIIDAIDACSIPIATVVEGKAASSAAVLASCGVEGFRYAGPNATITIHPAWMEGAGGNADDMETDVAELRRLNVLILERLSRNIGKEKNFVKKKLDKIKNGNWHLTPIQAKKINLVNKVKIPLLRTTAKPIIKFEG